MLKLSSNPTVNLFNYYEGTITKQKIMETEMASNSSFALTILCFLALQTPREFKNNEIVTLDQTFGESNQKQLHHIFPINYLKTKFSKERHYLTEVKPYINSIANISGVYGRVWHVILLRNILIKSFILHSLLFLLYLRCHHQNQYF